MTTAEVASDRRATMSGCRNTLDQLPAAACLLSDSAERLVLYANEGFYQMIGCPQGEFQYRFGGRLSAVTLGEWPAPQDRADGETLTLERRLKAEGLSDLWLRMEMRYARLDGEGVFLCIFSDITRERRALSALTEVQEFAECTDQFTGSESFEYDVMTQQAKFNYRGKILGQITPEEQARYGSFQEAALEMGLVEPPDQAAFRNAFASIRRLEHSVCEVRMRTKQGRTLWMRLSLKLRDQAPGEPHQAIGVLQNITEIKEAALQYLCETQFLQSLLAEKDAYALLNVSSDKILRVGGLWFSYSGQIRTTSYSALLEDYLGKTIHCDDLDYYLELLHPDNLIRSFENGADRLNCRVRRMLDLNTMGWTETNVFLFRDPASQSVEALVCMERQDKKTRPEPETKTVPPMGGERSAPPEQAPPDAEFEHFMSENGELAYLVDMDNFELLAGNEALYRRVGLTRRECRGKPCYWVMHQRKSPCPFCGVANWSKERFYIWKNWNETLQQNFLIKNKIVEWQGRDVLLAIAVDVQNNKSYIDAVEDGGGESHSVLCGIQRMAEARDRSAAVQSALETVGSFFGARAVQYWQFHPKEERFSCASEWKPDPAFLEDPGEKRIYQAVNQWLHKYRWTYPVVIENPEAMLCHSFEMYELLKEAGIENQRWVPLREGETLWGVLVIMNLSAHLQNESFLNTFIVFMLEEWRSRANMEGMLFASLHDALTGFSNRSSYEKYAQEFLPDEVSSLGVVSAAINDLKGINAQQGLQAGDDCVRHFATKFQSAFHEGRLFRLSGEAFLAVVPDFTQEKFVARMEEMEDEIVSCRRYTAYVGYAWDNIENELSVLIQQATQSMELQRKQQQDTNMKTSDGERQVMVQQLMQTLEKREFEVFLQPKMNLFTGALMGAEALVRYRDKEGGIVPPSHFIDVLEKQNLIRFIDFFVFEECCRVLEKWQKSGKALPVISFNFSRLTMLERDITTSVQAIYSKYSIPKDRMEIEITESVADLGKGALYQAAHALYQAGFGISLDDFGTKYTNLDILSELDFDMLKVDKSLVSSLTKRRNNQIILQNIITMCRHLNIGVIAEGVETKAQEEALCALGCRYGQGYLYGRPMPIPEFEEKFLSGQEPPEQSRKEKVAE